MIISNPSVCVIAVYFGELPNYMPLWLRSCEMNPTVSFLLITDQQVKDVPPNVRVVSIMLHQMKRMAEEKLGMKIALDTPYKCCDYKPVYGLIFEDYLEGVDYWGHADLDLLFGDLAGFFRKYDLAQYDKFLPLGHLAFYRNTDECNQRFRLTEGGENSFQTAFSKREVTQFDELGGMNGLYLKKGFPFFRERIFADISKSTTRLRLVENYPDAHEKNYPHQLFVWENGAVKRYYLENGTVRSEEFLYIHLKKRAFSPLAFDAKTAKCVYITPNALLEANGAPDGAAIVKLNPYRGALWDQLQQKYRWRIKTKSEKMRGALRHLPYLLFAYASRVFEFRGMSDATYLSLLYRAAMHKDLNLQDPRTFTEKLQWIKAYDHNPQYTVMVDKYAAKKWVAERIGEEHIVPTIGVWKRFDEIDFDTLPNCFVLKCTHDSHSAIICTDKQSFNKAAARRKLGKALKKNYYYEARQWPYKNVPPQIIAEAYLDDRSGEGLKDYKFFSFDGEPKVMYIAAGRSSGTTTGDFFDMDFRHLDLAIDHEPAEVPPARPDTFEEMKRAAAILSEGIPSVRVDFYEYDGQFYFGEMTFFHCGGFVPFRPDSWDQAFGSWVKLPKQNGGEKP